MKHNYSKHLFSILCTFFGTHMILGSVVFGKTGMERLYEGYLNPSSKATSPSQSRATSPSNSFSGSDTEDAELNELPRAEKQGIFNAIGNRIKKLRSPVVSIDDRTLRANQYAQALLELGESTDFVNLCGNFNFNRAAIFPNKNDILSCSTKKDRMNSLFNGDIDNQKRASLLYLEKMPEYMNDKSTFFLDTQVDKRKAGIKITLFHLLQYVQGIRDDINLIAPLYVYDEGIFTEITYLNRTLLTIYALIGRFDQGNASFININSDVSMLVELFIAQVSRFLSYASDDQINDSARNKYAETAKILNQCAKVLMQIKNNFDDLIFAKSQEKERDTALCRADQFWQLITAPE